MIDSRQSAKDSAGEQGKVVDKQCALMTDSPLASLVWGGGTGTGTSFFTPPTLV